MAKISPLHPSQSLLGDTFTLTYPRISRDHPPSALTWEGGGRCAEAEELDDFLCNLLQRAIRRKLYENKSYGEEIAVI